MKAKDLINTIRAKLNIRSVRRSRHDYQYVSKKVKDIVTVKYHDGTETIREFEQYLHSCSYCGKSIYFSHLWNKEEMKYFNKCKRGDCA